VRLSDQVREADIASRRYESKADVPPRRLVAGSRVNSAAVASPTNASVLDEPLLVLRRRRRNFIDEAGKEFGKRPDILTCARSLQSRHVRSAALHRDNSPRIAA